jgi:hypothetical protein
MFDLATGEHFDSSATPSNQAERPAGSSIRLQSASEESVLRFFHGLTIDERIGRFGSPATDDKIRAWRSSIDRNNYCAVSLAQGHHMVGLMELFGDKASGWQRPELALSVRRQRDTSAIRLHLVEIGLIAARERGARDVFVAFNSLETCMRAIVRQYGGLTRRQTRRLSPAISFRLMVPAPGALTNKQSVPLKGSLSLGQWLTRLSRAGDARADHVAAFIERALAR